MGELIFLSLCLFKGHQLKKNSHEERKVAGLLNYLSDKELLAPSLEFLGGYGIEAGVSALVAGTVLGVGWPAVVVGGIALGAATLVSQSGVYSSLENWFKSDSQKTASEKTPPFSKDPSNPNKDLVQVDSPTEVLKGTITKTTFAVHSSGCSFNRVEIRVGDLYLQTFCSQNISTEECLNNL